MDRRIKTKSKCKYCFFSRAITKEKIIKSYKETTYQIYEIKNYTLNTWLTALHDDDKERVFSEMKKFYESDNESINIKYRLKINNKIKHISYHVYKTVIDDIVYEVSIEREISNIRD